MGHDASDTIRRSLPASGIRAIFDRALELERSGRRILHLEIGRPDFALPPAAEELTAQALAEGKVHYVANRGILPLREQIAERIHLSCGHRYSAEKEIVVTAGASEGLAAVALALLGPGDEVLLPEPAWPHYRAVVELAGARVIEVPGDWITAWQIDLNRLAGLVTPRTKMVIVNTPGNPTGAVQSEETLREIARLAEIHGFLVLADDVYSDFTWADGKSLMSQIWPGSSQLILLDSISKSCAMTGWRVGWVAASAELADAINRVHQFLTVCGTAFAQYGAAAVLAHPDRPAWLQAMRSAMYERRKVWLDALLDCPGVCLKPPQGAFYLFPRLSNLRGSGYEFCRAMLEDHGVALVPGEVFGPSYQDCVRISHGGDLETQRAASTLLRESLPQPGGRHT